MARRDGHSESSSGSEASSNDGRPPKHVRKLERALIELETREAKLLRGLKAVSVDVIATRRRLAAARAGVDSGTSSGVAGPIGYCLREKRPVVVADARPVMLSNGRSAVAGTCSTCGARVVVLASRVEGG